MYAMFENFVYSISQEIYILLAFYCLLLFILTYVSGIHTYNNNKIAPMPVKQTWKIWANRKK